MPDLVQHSTPPRLVYDELVESHFPSNFFDAARRKFGEFCQQEEFTVMDDGYTRKLRRGGVTIGCRYSTITGENRILIFDVPELPIPIEEWPGYDPAWE